MPVNACDETVRSSHPVDTFRCAHYNAFVAYFASYHLVYRIRKGSDMKTAVIGYSGSGKSTLAETIGTYTQTEVLHLDAVHHLAGWQERSREEEQAIVTSFLDTHDAWIIDGNYTKVCYERRMEEADRIILLLFNRFSCLFRVTKRYFKYRNTVRPDMADGCEEKLDAEFILWVLFNGRRKSVRDRYAAIQRQYADKAFVIRSQKQLDAFLQNEQQMTAGNRNGRKKTA